MLTRQDIRRAASTLLLCGGFSCASAPPAPPPPAVEPSLSPSVPPDPPEADLSWAVDDVGPEPEADETFEVRESGLGVEELSVGVGPEANVGDELVVHYVGTLEDGTVFDSSRQRGTPLTFRIGDGRMIKGWEQGLLGMRQGGIRKLIIPPDLGYGARGSGAVPPDAILEFEIELVDIRRRQP